MKQTTITTNTQIITTMTTTSGTETVRTWMPPAPSVTGSSVTVTVNK